MKLSYREWLDRVEFVTKTRQDNNGTNSIGLVYAKNKIELLWLIGLSTVCDDNQTEQRRDRSYRCVYAKNENEYMLKNYKELLWSNWVRSVMKARQDNNVIDYIGLVDVKTETKLSRPIWLGVVCDEN